MRLGASVFGYKSAAQWADMHIRKGYGAAYWPLGEDADSALKRDYVNAAADAGLIIAEVGIWNNLLDPDAQKRRANFEYALRRLETAEEVGALLRKYIWLALIDLGRAAHAEPDAGDI